MKVLWLSVILALGAGAIQSQALARPVRGIPPQHHRCIPHHGRFCHHGPIGVVVRHPRVGIAPSGHHGTTVPHGGFTHGIPVEQRQGGGAAEH